MVELLTGPLPETDRIEFGKLFCPEFVTAHYVDGRWSELRTEPLRALELHPAAVVFHYAQSIFEGLKAYPRPKGAALFRPELNAQRFRSSAERLLLPVVEEDTFLEAVTKAVTSNLDYVPPRPGSLYLRPIMFGSEPNIGVRGSREAIFYVLAMPAGSYFREIRDGRGTIRVLVNESMARAARGGTGGVKAAATYAGTLQSIDAAKKRGCAQVMYLDAQGRGQIEEMTGMNVFFVLDNCLVTPPLGDTILPGITRASVIEAAGSFGLTCCERPITVHELREATLSGKLTEAFVCGTAATIVGISEFVFDSKESLHLPGLSTVTEKLFDYLQGVQYGTEPDVHGWMRPIL